MKTCENCIHNRDCIESANYRSAETCERYETLKPCPFCGGEAEISYGACDYNVYQATCKDVKCHAMVGWGDTSEEAVEMWNRRVENG